MSQPSGIIVDIYKSGGDCSNGGVSGRCRSLTLILPEGGPFEPDDERPGVVITHGNLPGCLKAVPVTPYGTPGDRDKVLGPMFGGTYIATSDSRFAERCEKLLGHRFYGAVPLHDRWETAAQYRALTS